MFAERYVLRVLSASSTLNRLQSHIHGLDHWFRVWTNAQALAVQTEHVDMDVVAMFALFHDSMRNTDEDDPDHGIRGYKLWRELTNELIREGCVPDFSYLQDDLLRVACEQHNKGQTIDDPTIGVCWDADRLDLVRTGDIPKIALMSTSAGQRLGFA